MHIVFCAIQYDSIGSEALCLWGREYDTKIDLQCTGLVGPQSIYRSLCRSITMHASTAKSGGCKSYYSICMLQRNMLLRQRLKDCTTVGAPSQAEVWLYGLIPPPPPPPPPLFVSATHLGHRPLVRSTFIMFRTPPPPHFLTWLRA